MPLDYANTLAAGRSLVPDLRQQLLQGEAMDMQREQFQWQRDLMEQKRQQLQQETQEQAAYKEHLEQALLSGDPKAIMRLMARFPQMAEGIKPLWESMDEQQRTADLTQAGTAFARAQAGDLGGAAAIIRQRVEADRAAGVTDPTDEAVLAGLESDDPIQQRAAIATIGIHVAALTGDKFSETYGKMNPADAKTGVQKEYDWRVAQFGQESADRWLATQDESLVAVEPGGSVYRKSDFVGAGAPQPGGGDQSTGSGAAPPADGPLGPWIEQVAGISASPRGRVRASGVAGTYHADDNARDFPTPSVAQNVAEGRRLKALFGPSFDVIYSENDKSGKHNDHVHVEPGPQLGAQVRGRGKPTKVRTKQEYDRLPVGTAYVAPDGSPRVKS